MSMALAARLILANGTNSMKTTAGGIQTRRCLETRRCLLVRSNLVLAGWEKSHQVSDDCMRPLLERSHSLGIDECVAGSGGGGKTL